MTVEVAELHGPGAYLDDLRSQQLRLVAMLEEIGGRTETRLRPDRPTRSDHRGARHLSLVPAGVPVWGHSDNIRYFRRMLLAFDAATVQSIVQDDPRSAGQPSPRLMFSDARVWRLAELLSAECESAEPLNRLYGDSLAAALLVGLLGPLGTGRTHT